MNNDDLDTLERVHILNAQAAGHSRDARAIQSAVSARSDADHDFIVGGAAVALTMQRSRNQLAEMESKLNKLQNNRNDTVAVVKASNETIKALVRRIAEVTATPLESVQREVNQFRTKTYDGIVDEWLENGNLVDDSRQDPEVMRHREWYQP